MWRCNRFLTIIFQRIGDFQLDRYVLFRAAKKTFYLAYEKFVKETFGKVIQNSVKHENFELYVLKMILSENKTKNWYNLPISPLWGAVAISPLSILLHSRVRQLPLNIFIIFRNFHAWPKILYFNEIFGYRM